MAIKSQEEIIEELREKLKEKTNIDTSIGTVARDILVDVPSFLFYELYQNLENQSQKYLLKNFDLMTDEELDDYAENFNIYRRQATKATGFVVFSRNDTSQRVIIPSGTSVITSTFEDGSVYEYVTTEDAVLDIGVSSITVPVEAIEEGSKYNIGSNTIIDTKYILPGIDSVTNPDPITGGTDTETNEELANRIKEKFISINQLTIGGLSNFIRENFTFVDLSVVGPEDEEMRRNIYGGAVDVYILTEDFILAQDVKNVSGNEYSLINRPVYEVVSVKEKKQNGDVIEIPKSDGNSSGWVFIKDNTGLYRWSYKSADKIQIINYNLEPTSQLIIDYKYVDLIKKIQDFINSPENHIITTDIIIFHAQKLGVDIEINVKLKYNFEPDSTKLEIEDAINKYFLDLKLGQGVEASDIVNVIYQTGKVETVEIPFVKFKTLNQTEDFNNYLTTKKYEYLRINNLVINLI